MVYKYAVEMALLGHCPPVDTVEYDRDAYRFVHAEMADTRNSLCITKLRPTRQLKPEQRCSGLGLSFFVSVESATKRFGQLIKMNPNIGNSLGNKLAVGTVNPDDGRGTPPGVSGHFDLWEAEAVDFASRFRIIADLSR